MNQSGVKTYIITDEDGVVRVDKFLAIRHPEYSRAALKKLFDMQLVKRDETVLKPGEKIRPGQNFTVDLSPLAAQPEVIDLPIIYEDQNVLVIDKPTGIISHARGKYWQEASVASFLRHHVGLDKNFFDSENAVPERAGIVHRLDRATSGVMICAKNEPSLKFLQKQFHDRKVVKTYLAVTSSVPKQSEAIIDAPIGRDLKDPKKFRINPQGKSAQTHYRLLRHQSDKALIELRPATGRTHQLRVHLAYIGCPIIGDELYGGKANQRLLLHAAELQITLPNGQNKKFSSPLPEAFDV